MLAEKLEGKTEMDKEIEGGSEYADKILKSPMALVPNGPLSHDHHFVANFMAQTELVKFYSSIEGSRKD